MNSHVNNVFNDPDDFSFEIKGERFETAKLRLLQANDTEKLTKFLASLSPTTQHFYKLESFDAATANQLCDDINKYDKIRFVAEMGDEIVALFEFSMDLVKDDIDRFKGCGIQLNQGTDCRFGPCVSDALQGTGFASAVFPYILKIAKKLNQNRIILWGGVFANNEKAIKYYKRNGFKEVGHFKNSDGQECIDMILEVATSPF